MLLLYKPYPPRHFPEPASILSEDRKYAFANVLWSLLILYLLVRQSKVLNNLLYVLKYIMGLETVSSPFWFGVVKIPVNSAFSSAIGCVTNKQDILLGVLVICLGFLSISSIIACFGFEVCNGGFEFCLHQNCLGLFSIVTKGRSIQYSYRLFNKVYEINIWIEDMLNAQSHSPPFPPSGQHQMICSTIL